MIPGLRYWILIWFGILLLGLVGLGGALYWGQRTHWKNLDEVFRGVGTVMVSAGMLLLLYRVLIGVGQLLLVLALACFVLAFIFGRRRSERQPGG
jgi:hypothetical protein